MSAPLRLCATNIRGADGQRPTAGHCVPSIDCEVDDDLLELTLVNLDGAKVPPVHDFQLDILTDQKGNTARVTIPDVYQSNGVITVIDKVLMP